MVSRADLAYLLASQDKKQLQKKPEGYSMTMHPTVQTCVSLAGPKSGTFGALIHDFLVKIYDTTKSK